MRVGHRENDFFRACHHLLVKFFHYSKKPNQIVWRRLCHGSFNDCAGFRLAYFWKSDMMLFCRFRTEPWKITMGERVTYDCRCSARAGHNCISRSRRVFELQLWLLIFLQMLSTIVLSHVRTRGWYFWIFFRQIKGIDPCCEGLWCNGFQSFQTALIWAEYQTKRPLGIHSGLPWCWVHWYAQPGNWNYSFGI